MEELGWKVVQRIKTPKEVREEYEALARVREKRRLQQKTKPTSRVEMTINAIDLLDRYFYDLENYDLIKEGGPGVRKAEGSSVPETTSHQWGE